MQILLPNVTLSFANIYTAKSVQGGEPRYSCNMIIDPETTAGAKLIDKIQKAIDKMTKDNFKGKKIPASKTCLHDGNDKDYEGYEDKMFVSAANKRRPQVVNRAKEPVQEEDYQAPYSGCIANVVVNLWAQDNQFGKRINASLEIVQFVKDGKRFGGSTASLADLPDVEDDIDDEEDDLG